MLLLLFYLAPSLFSLSAQAAGGVLSFENQTQEEKGKKRARRRGREVQKAGGGGEEGKGGGGAGRSINGEAEMVIGKSCLVFSAGT